MRDSAPHLSMLTPHIAALLDVFEPVGGYSPSLEVLECYQCGCTCDCVKCCSDGSPLCVDGDSGITGLVLTRDRECFDYNVLCFGCADATWVQRLALLKRGDGDAS